MQTDLSNRKWPTADDRSGYGARGAALAGWLRIAPLARVRHSSAAMSAQKFVAAAKTAAAQLQTTVTTKLGPTVVNGYKDLMARSPHDPMVAWSQWRRMASTACENGAEDRTFPPCRLATNSTW